jgi:hypothetical protein
MTFTIESFEEHPGKIFLCISNLHESIKIAEFLKPEYTTDFIQVLDLGLAKAKAQGEMGI